MSKRRNIINTIIEYHIHNCIKEKLDLSSIRVEIGYECYKSMPFFRVHKNKNEMLNLLKSIQINRYEQLKIFFPNSANDFQGVIEKINTMNLEELRNRFYWEEEHKAAMRSWIPDAHSCMEIEGNTIQRIPKIEINLKKTYKIHILTEEYIQELIQDESEKLYNELCDKLYVSLIFIGNNKARLDVSWTKSEKKYTKFERI